MSRIAIAASLFAVGCMAEGGTKKGVEPGAGEGQTTGLAAAGGTTTGGPFTVVKLTADTDTAGAPNVDPALVNSWGIVAFEQMFWIADNGTGKLSILDGQGKLSRGNLTSGAITLLDDPATGTPAPITGVALTGASPHESAQFQMHMAGGCMPAMLLVVGENGKMYGVNPAVSTLGGFMVADQSSEHAIYKGIAVLERKHDKRGPLILTTDFYNGRIDVYDANFQLLSKSSKNNVSFETPPDLVKNSFAPFNVAVIDDTVYVTYAKQDADKEDDVAGAGLGFVAAFSPNGHLRRLVTGQALNAPWAVVLARRFDSLRPSLLVGNFGSGQITVLEPASLKIRGQLKGQNGQPIMIDGLWGMAFGDHVRNARPDALYFAAGPDDEQHGLFGRIVPSRRCSGDGCK